MAIGLYSLEGFRDLTSARSLVLMVLDIPGSSFRGQCQSVAPLKMDQALLIFHNDLTEEVQIYYTSDYCYKCLYQLLTRVGPNNSSSSVIISTKFSLTMQVKTKTRNNTFCRWSQTYAEGGHYLINVEEVFGELSCSQIVQKSPHNVYLPLLVAALALLFLSSCLPLLHTSTGKFALTIMVFVNYGGGGYWFFQHAPWNGLTVADLLCLVVLAFSSMQKKGLGRSQLLRKVTWRTVVLLLLGFCFLNYSPRDGPLSWSWLRIPGVLQRLAATYLVLSLLQTLWGRIPNSLWTKPFEDLTLFWPQWLLMVLLETLWLCLTFLLPVPNCPRGYLGAGGIGDDGLYPNCTGGAAGFIDRWMFGDNMFRYPTCKEMYRTSQPFDPEGVLGTINSVLMGFLGMQAGKIIIFYKGSKVNILGRFAVWALLLGTSAAILTKCTRDAGFIPVNKTFGKSLSFVTCLGCFSFLLLGAMYFVIDVKGWWSGRPFIYPGTNSILVYVGHSLLGFYFPFSWDMRLQDSHWELLFMNLWGTALWVLISYLLHRKHFFLKI
ncbi:hypothetical protein WMY93_018463 [Mugilogobius chulae]|uniref:Heparan-alpha-glucosaminide N-acetyltransferase n=1 Tax=Mugilogobius chulae TaxID=88201 RepID=A0AAW0NQF6_9GOBI